MSEQAIAEKRIKEISMFGTTSEWLDESFKDSMLVEDGDSGKLMYAMQILSDAQEAMPGSKETARQYINRAKYFIEQVRKSK